MLSVSVRHSERPFWQKRYDDFNIHKTRSASRSCATCTETQLYAYT